MARGEHQPGKHGDKRMGEGRRSMNPPYPVTGPQTGTGRKAVGRKPHKAEIAQRTASGSILRKLTEALWRGKGK